MKKPTSFILSLAAFLSLGATASSADQITLRNGDILNGKVLAVTTDTLTIQDNTLGTLSLARAKVSIITFGMAATVVPPSAIPFTGTPQTTPKSTSSANTSPALQAMFGEIREHSNLVQAVEAQVLGSSASPAAINKFNELLDGLSTGQLDMNGLRAEAQSAANQLQEYKKEMGPNADAEVDSYLSILNGFLRETAPTNSASP
jgi:hypothetical protein